MTSCKRLHAKLSPWATPLSHTVLQTLLRLCSRAGVWSHQHHKQPCCRTLRRRHVANIPPSTSMCAHLSRLTAGIFSPVSTKSRIHTCDLLFFWVLTSSGEAGNRFGYRAYARQGTADRAIYQRGVKCPASGKVLRPRGFARRP